MRVHVVMGNDFPEAVFSSRDAAEKFCRRKSEDGSDLSREGWLRTKIHWRVYDFELDSKVVS